MIEAIKKIEYEFKKQFGLFLEILELKKHFTSLYEILKEMLREARLREEKKKRVPIPPYRERLHPSKDWQQQAYWLRIRSNPKRRHSYH